MQQQSDKELKIEKKSNPVPKPEKEPVKQPPKVDVKKTPEVNWQMQEDDDEQQNENSYESGEILSQGRGVKKALN